MRLTNDEARNAFDTVHFRCVCGEPSVGSIEKIEVRKLVLRLVFFSLPGNPLIFSGEMRLDGISIIFLCQ